MDYTSCYCVYNQRHTLSFFLHPLSSCCSPFSKKAFDPSSMQRGGAERWLMVPIIGEGGGAGAPLMNLPRDERLWGWSEEEELQQERRYQRWGLRVWVCACRGGGGQGGVTSCHTAGKSAPVSHICQRAPGPCLRAAGSKGKTSPCRALRSHIHCSQ